MDLYYLLCVIIVIATIFSFINHKFIHWPSPVAMIAFSLVTSTVILLLRDSLPAFSEKVRDEIASINFYNIFMRIFFGFILFAGAFRVSLQRLMSQLRDVTLLATIGTMLSAAIVSGLVYFLFRTFDLGIPYSHCLVFGALISPTDPVAVLAAFKKANIPQTFHMKIVGESLFNDGVGIVLFAGILSYLHNACDFTCWDAVLLFLRETAGGIAFGSVLSVIAHFSIRSIDDYKVEILITIVIVMIGFTTAGILGVSAPIAIVIAGLIAGNVTRKNEMSEISKKSVTLIWELIDNLLNIILYLLLGFELLVMPVNISILLVAAGCVVVVLLGRLVSVSLTSPLFSQGFNGHATIALTWCGLRGSVSLALALSVPLEFHRHYFVIMAYVVAVFSTIVQGLTAGKLVEHLFDE